MLIIGPKMISIFGGRTLVSFKHTYDLMFVLRRTPHNISRFRGTSKVKWTKKIASVSLNVNFLGQTPKNNTKILFKLNVISWCSLVILSVQM